MKRTSDNSFVTKNLVNINAHQYGSDQGVCLNIKGITSGGNVHLYPDEVDALITVLRGGVLSEPEPEFKVGDIVRLVEVPSRSMTAKPGALARVTGPASDSFYGSGGYLPVKWIDSRAIGTGSFSQHNGKYAVEDFVLVDKSELTPLDYIEIAERALSELTD